jgi:hypothetical protein
VTQPKIPSFDPAAARWRRLGPVAGQPGLDKAGSVCGDPCVVWDEEEGLWRMFLFQSPPGHGQAVCRDRGDPGPGNWEFLGPLAFENPRALLGGETHKPFVVLKPDGGNQAARVHGRFCLLTVSFLDRRKVLQRAWSEHLAGPWTLESEPLLEAGIGGDFDARHQDAVSGYYFEERDELYVFYMGYPLKAQPQALSPFGSAQALAVQGPDDTRPRKCGIILPPSAQKGHWASGWVGGFQIFPGKKHAWVGLANASPSAPDPGGSEVSREEPPPSLGGFAYTDDASARGGWRWFERPLERVEDLPREAQEWGEGVNLWRQHLLSLPGGRRLLLYNSGSYGYERLFAQETRDADLKI